MGKISDVKDIEILALNPTPRRNAVLKSTRVQRKEKAHWKRNLDHGVLLTSHGLLTVAQGSTKKNDWSDIKPSTLTERGALREANRCLKCADAPCTKSCPTQLDVKHFIQCISTRVCSYVGCSR